MMLLKASFRLAHSSALGADNSMWRPSSFDRCRWPHLSVRSINSSASAFAIFSASPLGTLAKSARKCFCTAPAKRSIHCASVSTVPFFTVTTVVAWLMVHLPGLDSARLVVPDVSAGAQWCYRRDDLVNQNGE